MISIRSIARLTGCPSKEIPEEEKRAVLDRLWNFLATQERKEEDLAADREIDDFLYGDAL